MEQELRFGLDLGWLAILLGADYEQLLRAFFYVFGVKKKIKFVLKTL